MSESGSSALRRHDAAGPRGAGLGLGLALCRSTSHLPQRKTERRRFTARQKRVGVEPSTTGSAVQRRRTTVRFGVTERWSVGRCQEVTGEGLVIRNHLHVFMPACSDRRVLRSSVCTSCLRNEGGTISDQTSLSAPFSSLFRFVSFKPISGSSSACPAANIQRPVSVEVFVTFVFESCTCGRKTSEKVKTPAALVV